MIDLSEGWREKTARARGGMQSPRAGIGFWDAGGRVYESRNRCSLAPSHPHEPGRPRLVEDAPVRERGRLRYLKGPMWMITRILLPPGVGGWIRAVAGARCDGKSRNTRVTIAVTGRCFSQPHETKPAPGPLSWLCGFRSGAGSLGPLSTRIHPRGRDAVRIPESRAPFRRTPWRLAQSSLAANNEPFLAGFSGRCLRHGQNPPQQ